jgi:hypothetical protein
MHLGKFNYAIRTLNLHYKQADLLTQFDQVISALTAYNASPTKDNSTQFRERISSLYEAIEQAPKYLQLPSLKEIVSEIGAANKFGADLRSRIDATISNSASVPVEMLQAITDLRNELEIFVKLITRLADAMEELHVEYDRLDGNEYELGLLFPKVLIGETLECLMFEMKHISRLMGTINELLGRANDSTKVRTISASWWQFFLEIDYSQVAAVTFALERCIALYKSGLEIKKLKREAEKLQLGDELLEKLDERIALKTKEGMDEIASEFRTKFSKEVDAARNNELQIQFRLELNHLMRRLSEGAKIEIRVPILEAPTRPDDAMILANPALRETFQQELDAHEQQTIQTNEIQEKTIVLIQSLDNIENDPDLLSFFSSTDNEKDAKL